MTTPVDTRVDDASSNWISARHVQHIVTSGESIGLPMSRLLQEAGLTRAAFADVDGQVPISYVEQLLTVSARHYDDPLIGLHLAQQVQPATFGAIGFIAQACPRFADVLAVITRFNGLLSDIGKVSVTFAPGTVAAHWECAAGGPLFRRHANEYVLGAFVTLGRLLLPNHATVFSAIYFQHDAPSDPKLLHKYLNFFQCPVYFGESQSSVVMPADVLRTPMRHGDAFMKDLLERHALQQLKQRQQEPSLADTVKHLIAGMLHEYVPDKERIAAQLGISGRSLHRRLQLAGTSYRELLDEVRLDIAKTHLLDNNDSLADVADLLRFSTHQAFIRWFREHTGSTPGDFRRHANDTRSPTTASDQESTS